MQFTQTIISALLMASAIALPTVNEQQTAADSAGVSTAQSWFDCLNRMEPHGPKDWPHFDCEGRRWALDNNMWNYAPDCYNLCKPQIEDQLKQGHDSYMCEIHSGLARCNLYFGPI